MNAPAPAEAGTGDRLGGSITANDTNENIDMLRTILRSSTPPESIEWPRADRSPLRRHRDDRERVLGVGRRRWLAARLVDAVDGDHEEAVAYVIEVRHGS